MGTYWDFDAIKAIESGLYKYPPVGASKELYTEGINTINDRIITLQSQLNQEIIKRDTYQNTLEIEKVKEQVGGTPIEPSILVSSLPSMDSQWYSDLLPSIPQPGIEEPVIGEPIQEEPFLKAGISPWILILLAGLTIPMILGGKGKWIKGKKGG